jgi:hypothetical protein
MMHPAPAISWFITSLILAACSQHEGKQESEAGGTKVPGEQGRSYQAEPIVTDGTETLYSPTEITTAFRNPDKGWITYDFNPVLDPGGGKSASTSSIFYTNAIAWGDLEPYQGIYRWHVVDRLLNSYPNQKGHIGIILLDPTSMPWCGPSGMGQTPTWLANQLYPSNGGRWTAVMEGLAVPSNSRCGTGPGAVFEPYYWDTRFLDAHAKFVYALAKRYFNNDKETAGYDNAVDWKKRIATLDISTYGAWGEWHSDIKWPSDAVKRNTLNAMILHFHQAFAYHARLTNSMAFLPRFEISTVGATVGPSNDIFANNDPSQNRFAVESATISNGTTAGMVRKFLGADPSIFFKPDEQTIVSSNIDKAPFRLEWGSCDGTITTKAFACLGGTPMSVEQAVDYALTLKADRIGWYRNDSADGSPLSKLKSGTNLTLEDYFQTRAGYRFYISKFLFPKRSARGKALTINQTWNQRATGKIYQKYDIAAYLKKGATERSIGVSDSFSAHTWAPGPISDVGVASNFTVPTDLPAGAYDLMFAIVDGFGAPAMNLAISGKDVTDVNAYGKYKLGTIQID